MSVVDVSGWVNSSKDKREIEFRQAVHTVLVAVSKSPLLNQSMFMKGGILLALAYNGIRYTRDIDFSTATQVSGFDENEFLREFQRNLAVAVEELSYGLDCRIQSHEMRPPATAGHTHPTYKIKFGYAPKSDASRHRRLLNKLCPTIVEVDYSFNEPNYDHTDEIQLNNGEKILVYSIIDLIAEKIRSILQQEVRGRVRRQDAYDLYCLLKGIGELDEEQKKKIHDSLLLKSNARGLDINSSSMNNPEIERRSKLEYNQLAGEVEGELPEFNLVFEYVVKFYSSLPWEQMRQYLGSE